MALSYEDISPDLRKVAEQNREQKIVQLRHQVRVGEGMQALTLSDPNWQIFVSHITALKAPHESHLKAVEARLLDRKFLDDKEYGQLKLEQIECKTRVDDFNLMLNLAEALVKQGQKAMEELTGVAKPTWD